MSGSSEEAVVVKRLFHKSTEKGRTSHRSREGYPNSAEVAIGVPKR